MEPEDSPGRDPFEGIAFDEDFINQAPIREASAQERLNRFRYRAPDPEPIHVKRSWFRRRGHRQPHAYRPRRSDRHGMRGLVVLVCLALVLHMFNGPRGTDSASIWIYSSGENRARHKLIDAPTPQKAASEERLGTPLSPSPNHESYGFVFTQEDGTTPVTYDPCRPISVVMNNRTAPAYGAELVEEGLAEISRITGLVFSIEGETNERPFSQRSPYLPDRYGERWAPVLVAWSDPGETPDLEGLVTGIGGSSYIASADRASVTYVSGIVILDGPQLDQAYRFGGGRQAVLGVILHELGHLVGLNHIEDATQLMYEQARDNVTTFQDGDITGLIQLGQGACVPKL